MSRFGHSSLYPAAQCAVCVFWSHLFNTMNCHYFPYCGINTKCFTKISLRALKVQKAGDQQTSSSSLQVRLLLWTSPLLKHNKIVVSALFSLGWKEKKAPGGSACGGLRSDTLLTYTQMSRYHKIPTCSTNMRSFPVPLRTCSVLFEIHCLSVSHVQDLRWGSETCCGHQISFFHDRESSLEKRETENRLNTHKTN